MSTTVSPLSAALSSILSAVEGVITEIANVVEQNASLIGDVVAIGALVFLVVKFGNRVFGALGGLLQGFNFGY